MQILTSANKFDVVLNFWISNMKTQELNMLINKSIMSIISILCVNPTNQNERIKENFKFIIDVLLSLIKKVKKKTKKDINPEDLIDEEEEFEDDDEKEDKFAKVKMINNK
jgi:hypothetical protein